MNIHAHTIGRYGNLLFLDVKAHLQAPLPTGGTVPNKEGVPVSAGP